MTIKNSNDYPMDIFLKQIGSIYVNAAQRNASHVRFAQLAIQSRCWELFGNPLQRGFAVI